METKRLLLRRFEKGDINDFFEYASQDNVGIDAGWKKHESIAESLEILEKFISDEEVYAVVLKENGKVIGSVGLHTDAKQSRAGFYREVGYVISSNYRNQGFITEAVKAILDYAFKILKLDFVILSAFEYNLASQRVAEKCGFIHEGTIHFAAERFDGIKVDLVWFYMTKERHYDFNLRY